MRIPLRRSEQGATRRAIQRSLYGNQHLPDGALDPWPVCPVFRGIGLFQLLEASLCQLHGKGELLVGCNFPVS
jgi:hypothetical protein